MIAVASVSIRVGTRHHVVELFNKHAEYPKLTGTSHVGDEPEP